MQNRWFTAAEFWNLHPFEFWWAVEAALDQKVYGNGMTHREVRELYEATYGHGDS